mmetsp:Transcript_11916/g.21812  ORF Transcript_11916/g.21812 Transcript_11916/m.21812 type:complete len:238 (-) Transcript_11916:18-731(-)
MVQLTLVAILVRCTVPLHTNTCRTGGHAAVSLALLEGGHPCNSHVAVEGACLWPTFCKSLRATRSIAQLHESMVPTANKVCALVRVALKGITKGGDLGRMQLTAACSYVCVIATQVAAYHEPYATAVSFAGGLAHIMVHGSGLFAEQVFCLAWTSDACQSRILARRASFVASASMQAIVITMASYTTIALAITHLDKVSSGKLKLHSSKPKELRHLFCHDGHIKFQPAQRSLKLCSD